MEAAKAFSCSVKFRKVEELSGMPVAVFVPTGFAVLRLGLSPCKGILHDEPSCGGPRYLHTCFEPVLSMLLSSKCIHGFFLYLSAACLSSSNLVSISFSSWNCS